MPPRIKLRRKCTPRVTGGLYAGWGGNAQWGLEQAPQDGGVGGGGEAGEVAAKVGGRKERLPGRGGGRREGRGQTVGQAGRGGGDLIRSALPGLVDGGEHPPEGREPRSLPGREVGPAEEQPAFRGEEGGEGPARLPGECLYRPQEESVHIGPFLSIHLDGDEPTVQEIGGGGIRERLGAITRHQWQEA